MFECFCFSIAWGLNPRLLNFLPIPVSRRGRGCIIKNRKPHLPLREKVRGNSPLAVPLYFPGCSLSLVPCPLSLAVFQSLAVNAPPLPSQPFHPFLQYASSKYQLPTEPHTSTQSRHQVRCILLLSCIPHVLCCLSTSCRSNPLASLSLYSISTRSTFPSKHILINLCMPFRFSFIPLAISSIKTYL